MSMISSLIDELRQMADGQATYRDAREVMLEAADTIWQLRDDLQRANADNAKLREEFDKMDVWHSKELSAAMAENAKLRKLVNLMAIEFRDMSSCSETPCPECPVRMECDCEQQLMSELWVEV